MPGGAKDKSGLDAGELLNLAREMGKGLAAFRAPAGFAPEPAPLEPVPAPDMVRDLGAKSLSEFFAASFGEGEALTPLPPILNLPKGPDSLEAALAAVGRREAALEREMGREAARGSPEGRRLEAARRGLSRARQLVPLLKAKSDEWPKALREMREEAANLKQAAAILTRAPAGPGGEPDPAADAVGLVSLSSSLKEGLVNHRRLLSRRLGWRSEARSLGSELESLSAAAFGASSDRGWRPLLVKLRTRYENLAEVREELELSFSESARSLGRDLERLERVEREASGGYEAARREQGEALMGQVRLLWGAALKRRQELAKCWRELPALVGRPAFLDRMFLYSAVILGRIQSACEEASLALERFNSRRSGTCTIRAAAKEALAVMGRDQEGPRLLARARRRLDEVERQVFKLRRMAEGLGAPPKKPLSPGEAIEEERDQPDLFREGEFDQASGGPGSSFSGREALYEDEDSFDDYLEPLDSAPFGDDYFDGADKPRRGEEAERSLRAVDRERRRLDETLSEARGELQDHARRKLDILRSLKEAEAALEEATRERERLSSKLRDASIELDRMRRRDDALSETYRKDKARLKELEERHQALGKARRADRQALLAYQAERGRLIDSIKAHKGEIEARKSERDELSKAQAALKTEIDEIRAKEAGLAVELGGRDEELKEANRVRERLSQAMASYRTQLDRLIIAHNALKASWARRGEALAEGEAEREELRSGLDKQNRELVDLATKREELLRELGDMRLRLSAVNNERLGLNEELDRLRREAGQRAEAAGGLEREKEALLAELERLKAEAAASFDAQERLKAAHDAAKREADEDLKPLVQALALALWRSEAYLKVVQDGVEAKLEKERRLGQAREAEIRVSGAVKEIDYLETISSKDKELTELKAERDSLASDLAKAGEASGSYNEELVKRSWLAHQLSMALNSTNLRNERLRRGLKDLRSRFNLQREESKTIKTELEQLVRSQAQALADHKSWLASLAPLVGELVQCGADFWQTAARDDARDAVLFFMTKENALLTEELGSLRTERQSLYAERREYQGLYERMRERLAELKPLMEFLVVKFSRTCADLASAFTERDALRADVKELMALNQGVLALPSPEGAESSDETQAEDASQAPLRAEVAKARYRVAALTLENQSLADAVRSRERALEEKGDSLRELEDEKGRLAEKLIGSEKELAESKERLLKLDKDRAQLLASMERQGLDLAQAKNDANRLAQERDRYKTEAEKRAQELGALQDRLTELKDARSPQTDGRLESAWAAMTYLSSKAGDAMGNLQAKLERQTRELEGATNELKRKEAEIRRLEERQDNLSILYWTMLSLAAESPAPGAELEGLEGERAADFEEGAPGFEERAPGFEERMISGQADAPQSLAQQSLAPQSLAAPKGALAEADQGISEPLGLEETELEEAVQGATSQDATSLDAAAQDAASLDAAKATELGALELEATELEATELAATDIEATELAATEIDAVELEAAEANATELVPTELEAAEPSAGVVPGVSESASPGDYAPPDFEAELPAGPFLPAGPSNPATLISRPPRAKPPGVSISRHTAQSLEGLPEQVWPESSGEEKSGRRPVSNALAERETQGPGPFAKAKESRPAASPKDPSAGEGPSLDLEAAAKKAELAEAQGPSSESADGAGEGEGKRGGALLSDLRKAARRGILSLFVTGGMVLMMPGLIGASDAGEQGAPGPFEIGPSSYARKSGLIAVPPLTRWRSSYLGRTLEIGPMGAKEAPGGVVMDRPAISPHPLLTFMESEGEIEIFDLGPGSSSSSSSASSRELKALPAVFKPMASQSPAKAPKEAPGPAPRESSSFESLMPESTLSQAPIFKPSLAEPSLDESSLDESSLAAPSGFSKPEADKVVVMVGSGPLPGEDAFGRPIGEKDSFSAPPPGLGLSTSVEDAIRRTLEDQARRWSQTPGDWLALIRQACGPEDTVSLGAFSGPDAPARLLEPVMPLLGRALRRCPKALSLAPSLLSSAAAFGAGEGAWWDRLFKRFRDKMGNDQEAIEGLVGHLERKSVRALAQVEFGGTMRPLRALENIPLEKAAELLSLHVSKNWAKGRSGRKLPGEAEKARLAWDLVQTAKLYRLPRTLLAIVAHDDFISRGRWPDTMELCARAAWLSWEIGKSLIYWSPAKPPLCDTDALALRLLESAPNPAGLNQAHMSLLIYFDSHKAIGSTLFPRG
jgi:chromosome segregation ATPase